MTTQNEIPADVWEIACQVSYDMSGSESGDLTIIARAIFAERERCIEAIRSSMHERDLGLSTGDAAISKITGEDE